MYYLVFPVFLIPKVIKYLEKCRCKGVLIVPYWSSAVFWPLVCEIENIYKPFIFVTVKKLKHKAITKNPPSTQTSLVPQF